MRNLLLINAILFISAFINFSFGQSETSSQSSTSFIHGTRLNTGVNFQYWLRNVDLEADSNDYKLKLTETVIPVYYSMDLDNYIKGLSIDIVTSPTVGTYSNSNYQLSGYKQKGSLFKAAQTKIRGSYNLKNIVLFTTGFHVPTASNKLEDDVDLADPSSLENNYRTAVRSMLAAEEYSWRVTRINSGLNYNLTASTSYEIFDDLVIGASLGYLMNGTYTPNKGGNKFNPADQFTFIAGCDYTAILASTPVQFMGDVIFLFYGKDRDKTNDNDILYDPANGFGINLRSSFKTRKGLKNITFLSLYFWGTSENVLNSVETNIGNNYSLIDYLYLNRLNNITPFLKGQIKWFTSDRITKAPSWQNKTIYGKAFLGGLGGGINLSLSRQINIRSNAMFNLGGKEGDFIFGTEIGGMIEIIF